MQQAIEEYIDELTMDINESLEAKDYEEARTLLDDGAVLVGERDELTELREKIEEEIKNRIDTYKNEEAWRAEVDYLNSNPEWKVTFQSDYDYAVSQYNSMILESAVELKEQYKYQEIHGKKIKR